MDRLVETRHVSAVDYRDVTVGHQQHDEPNRWLFLPQSSGGSISLPSRGAGQQETQLYWHLHNHTTSILTLAELSLTSGHVGRGVKLHIPGQVFTALAHHISDDACYLFLLLSSKSVGVLQLPLPAARQQQLRGSHNISSSILDAVQQHSLLQLQLSQQLASLGVPTALTTADGFLCIAGSSGSVTCLPLQTLTAGQLPQPSTAQQLNPSNFVVQVRRRMGFAATSSIVAAVPINIPSAGHNSLLVVHEDTSCHQWFVQHGRQGYSQTLVSDAAARQLRPNRVLLCHAAASNPDGSRRLPWDVLLVWDMGLADSSGQSDVRIMPYRIAAAGAAAAAGTGSGGTATAKLEQQLPQPQLLQLEWPDAVLVDARLEGQQLLLLCSTKAGASFVVSYSFRDWSYQGRVQLLEQKATAEWGMKEELWSAALAAFPEDVSPATQVLGQLLVPGQLCISALRQALAYHGAQLTEQEAAGASLAQLQARITAAVELIKSRYPSYSAARCWHNLFASYCEFWQQQHALVCLYNAPGGWFGAVRAGGLLTVMRRASPSEVLLSDNSQRALEGVIQEVGVQGTSGIPGGAAALAKVRLCLATIGDVLGTPTMRLMTQLVMAGVSVEGELVPKFVELLLQGPPVSTQQLAGDGAAGSSAAAAGGVLASDVQQRLAEWRMYRQAQLLSVYEQLAELPHALETLSGVADLTIKTAIAAAAHLRPPAAGATLQQQQQQPNPGPQVGTLLSSIALHTTRASCMALQQLLLLLGCLKQLGSVGATPLTAADQAALSCDLIPPLTTALRSAAVSLWLCKTPSSSHVAGVLAAGGAGGSVLSPTVPGPLLGLRNPTPSGTPASTPRGADGLAAAAAVVSPTAAAAAAGGAGVTAPAAPSWQYPLAAHLLPLFWKQQGPMPPSPGSQLSALGNQLAVWLMLGGGAEAAAAAASGSTSDWAVGAAVAHMTGGAAAAGASSVQAAVTNPEGLAGRAVLIGYQLFVCREYDSMQRLVKLIGGEDPSEAGLQFILGLSLACGIQQARLGGSGGGLGFQNHAALLDSAVGHLFRAAAGLCGEEAVPLRLVLQLLRQRQGSSNTSSGAGNLAATANGLLTQSTAMELDSQEDEQGAAAQLQREARLKLEFCQAVMLLFEREGVTSGALEFARAALGAVDAAYSPQQQHEKVQQQAALWTSGFNFACDLDLIHDAYTAALSTPIPERAAEAVRRLAQALVDRGEIGQLIALPWAGVLLLNRQGLQEPVPVVELVIDKLVRRALHGELSLEPSAQQVLFDFLVSRGSYKYAAAAMLSYGRRLRAAAAAGHTGRAHSVTDLTEEVMAAYDSSIAMLLLLDPADAWLDPDQPLLAPWPAPPPRIAAATNKAALSTSPLQLSSTTAAAAAAGALSSLASIASQLPVLSVELIKQEAALFSASVLLLQHLPGLEIMQYDLSAVYVFEQLLGSRQFSAALQLAHAVWEMNGQLPEKLEAVTFALAGNCVELQGSEGAPAGPDGGAAAGPDSQASLERSVISYTGPGYMDSAAASAWNKLRQLLELYDDQSSSSGSAAGLSSRANNGGNGVDSSSSSSSSVSALGGRLRLAAVDGALAANPSIQLPAWLLGPFQPRAGAAGGMTGAGPDPAGLLRVYVNHGRLVDAAQLVKDHLEAWQRQGPLLRAQPAAVWIPWKDLELLHASLVAGAQRAGSSSRIKEAEVLGMWSEVLEAGVADHLALVRSDGEQLSAAAPPSARGQLGGLVGMVF